MAFKALECETQQQTTSCEISTPTFCWKIIQSCYTSAVGGSWLWQMCNVERRGGESSLCTTPPSPHPSPLYNLLHRLHRSDRSWSWFMLACFWFCFASFTSLYICYSRLHPPQLGIILSFTSSQSRNIHVQLIHSAPQLNWRRAPPCFLAASLPLLELLVQVSQWAMVRQRCLLFKQKSTSDQNDVGTALLLAMFYVSKIDAWHVK